MDGVFTQHFRVFTDRHIYGNYPTDWVYAYRNYANDVWWTRTSTAYSLSGHQESWNFGLWKCIDGTYGPQSSTSTAWLPTWASSTSTQVYHYYGPMNTWPIIWAGKCSGCGIITVAQWTDVLENGWFATRLNGSVTFPKN